MEESELNQIQRWVRNWHAAGAKLDELRRRELPLVNTQQALFNLADAFEACRLHSTPAPTSGLVIQQSLFRRLPK
jgi:hypothetical protein